MGRGGESAGAAPPRVDVHEIDAGEVLRDERMVVRAFKIPHGTWPQAFGFKFVTGDKTIVISGDTA
jgi:ribonuclease Z